MHPVPGSKHTSRHTSHSAITTPHDALQGSGLLKSTFFAVQCIRSLQGLGSFFIIQTVPQPFDFVVEGIVACVVDVDNDMFPVVVSVVSVAALISGEPVVEALIRVGNSLVRSDVNNVAGGEEVVLPACWMHPDEVKVQPAQLAHSIKIRFCADSHASCLLGNFVFAAC